MSLLYLSAMIAYFYMWATLSATPTGQLIHFTRELIEREPLLLKNMSVGNKNHFCNQALSSLMWDSNQFYFAFAFSRVSDHAAGFRPMTACIAFQSIILPSMGAETFTGFTATLSSLCSRPDLMYVFRYHKMCHKGKNCVQRKHLWPCVSQWDV